MEELHKHASFVVHGKRRKCANKRYRDNTKLKLAKTIALRWKRVASKKAGLKSEFLYFCIGSGCQRDP